MSSLDGSVYRDILKKKRMVSERSQSTPMSKVSTDSVTTNYKPDLRSGREGSESLK